MLGVTSTLGHACLRQVSCCFHTVAFLSSCITYTFILFHCSWDQVDIDFRSIDILSAANATVSTGFERLWEIITRVDLVDKLKGGSQCS